MRRLDKARALLGGRLTRRGVTIGAALMAAGLSRTSSAAAPATLVEATVKAVKLVAEGWTTTLAVSARVATLTQGVLNAMFMNKLKVTHF
jgi:hypothetical protein